MSAPSLQRVYLMGLRGAGKTSVGKAVAGRLEWSFLDTDAEIARHAGASIQDIFRNQGESAFRRQESAILRRAAQAWQTVISTGGGIVTVAENRGVIQDDEAALRVWLTASPETLAKRIAADPNSAGQRPRLTGAETWEAEMRELLAARGPHYAALADLTVDTDSHTVQEAAARIVSAVLSTAWL
jgi:shikimate kinase